MTESTEKVSDSETSQTRQRLYDEMKICMKSGAKERLGVMRMLITEIKNAEINDPTHPGRQRNEAEVMTLIGAYHKALTKSLTDFPESKHPPIKAELAIVEEFLPRQLSESEISGIITQVLSETADRNFGLLMKRVQTLTAGQAPGQLVSSLLKNILAQDAQT